MSRNFDGSTGRLELSSAVSAAIPLTMSCWFRANTSHAGTLIDIADSGVTEHSTTLQIRSSGEVSARSRAGGGSSRALTTTNYSTTTWHHACGTWAATNDRKSYIDGGSEGTNTQVRDPLNEDRTFIGAAADSSISEFFDGRLAEAAIWDVVLSLSEITALANGWSPLRVRPTALLAYWPLYRDGGSGNADMSGGGFNLTEVGTVTVADHSPTASPFAFDVFNIEEAEKKRRVFNITL